MILFGTTDSSLDYSKTKGRDIMSSPTTPVFLTPRNIRASTFSNTTADWGRSLFSLGYIECTWQGFFGGGEEHCSCDLWEQGSPPQAVGDICFSTMGYILYHLRPWCSLCHLSLFPSSFLCLSSVFCPFSSMFSWSCHKLGGWAQLCPVVGLLWNRLCLAQRMPWSLITAATLAANPLPWTPSTRGR